jgi:hypothetical protein
MATPNHPAKVECPAVAEMVRALQSVIPELRGHIGTVRDDGSRHTAGLAADIMLDSTDQYEKMIADDIIAALIDLQSQMRWHDILYTDWLPGSGPKAPPRAFHFHIPGGGGGYGGKRLTKNLNPDVALGLAHENHIHIDWVDFSLRIKDDTTFVYDWPSDARSTGFGAALSNALMFSSRR